MWDLAFFALAILLHVKLYKHNEAQKFVAECIKNVGMVDRKLQKLVFFYEKDTLGMDTSDIPSIILRIHINEEELQRNVCSDVRFCPLHYNGYAYLNWYNETGIRLMQKWKLDWSSN